MGGKKPFLAGLCHVKVLLHCFAIMSNLPQSLAHKRSLSWRGGNNETGRWYFLNMSCVQPKTRRFDSSYLKDEEKQVKMSANRADQQRMRSPATSWIFLLQHACLVSKITCWGGVTKPLFCAVYNSVAQSRGTDSAICGVAAPGLTASWWGFSVWFYMQNVSIHFNAEDCFFFHLPSLIWALRNGRTMRPLTFSLKHCVELSLCLSTELIL